MTLILKQQYKVTPLNQTKFAVHYTNCAEILMKRGQFKAAEKIIDLLGSLSININDQLKIIGSQIKKDIDAVVQISTAKKPVQTVTPVFQWAQNRHHLIMQVKFAHRHDSPGCLDPKNTIVDINPNWVFLSADCGQGSIPLHYVLNITLLEPVDPSKSMWKLESVGRLFINVTKTVQVIWEKLLLGDTRIPQMRVWWDMQDNEIYAKDMETFATMIDDADDKDACLKNKKCKAKRDANKNKVSGGGNIIDGRRVDGDDLSKFINMG